MQNVVKPLVWALLGGGLAVMSTAGAFDLPWFKSSAKPPVALAPVAAAVQQAPLPPLPPGSAPNYRAIVQQYGPAVVGVVVQGLHKVTAEESAAAAEAQAQDPMYRYFRTAT